MEAGFPSKIHASKKIGVFMDQNVYEECRKHLHMNSTDLEMNLSKRDTNLTPESNKNQSFSSDVQTHFPPTFLQIAEHKRFGENEPKLVYRIPEYHLPWRQTKRRS